MESELEPCPVCGSSVNPAGEALLVGLRLFCCSSRVCAYVLIDTIPSRQAHNTLSREARVGRLVEKIFFDRTDFEAGRMLLVAESEGSAVAGMTAAVSIWKEEYGDTLLAALESLAAAVGGDE